jgi:hypothetical protein
MPVQIPNFKPTKNILDFEFEKERIAIFYKIHNPLHNKTTQEMN